MSVPISHPILNLLTDLGWLPAELSEDRGAVADAVRRVLVEAARYGGADSRLPYCSSAKGPCR